MVGSNLTQKGSLVLGYAAAALVTASLLLGPAHASGPGEPWHTALGRDHPLVGKIWDVSAGGFIDATTLVERLARDRFILLGEKHDNPDHHRLQAWVVHALITAGRRPAVGFEMFTTDDGPGIAQQLAAAPTDAAGLADAVAWGRSGWPDWELYRPIAEAALAAKLPIVATNLPPATARALARDGLAAMDTALATRLGLDRPLALETYAEMAADIRDAHCGQASAERVKAMITVQRARDAYMAEHLIAGADGQDSAVLIAGVEHARNDRGVPTYLAVRASHATVISLAFLEVRPGHTEPTAYTARFGRGPLPFHYVWFTPRLDDVDPCEKFGTQLEQLRKGP